MKSKPDCVFGCLFYLIGSDLNVLKCYQVGMNRKNKIVVRDRGESFRWFCKSSRKMMRDKITTIY